MTRDEMQKEIRDIEDGLRSLRRGYEPIEARIARLEQFVANFMIDRIQELKDKLNDQAHTN